MWKRANHDITSRLQFTTSNALSDPMSMLSFPSRFTNTLLFSPSCWRMRRSSRQLVAALHRRHAIVDRRQAYVNVQPVKSRGATAALVPAQDVQSGMISSPRVHPRPHSSRVTTSCTLLHVYYFRLLYMSYICLFTLVVF